MPGARALCIFSTILGKKAMVSMLKEILDGLPGLEPAYVMIGDDDYRAYPPPFWTKAVNPWQAEWIARGKAAPELGRQYDFLLVNTWEFVTAFRDLARRMPAAAIMDAVPATIDGQLRARGQGGWKRRLAHQVHHRRFAAAAREFDYFLPKGSDCRDSLCRDYGIAPERCFVTLLPQRLDRWTPLSRAYAPPLRLLFVGNDFVRKGGDFLLRLYAGRLADFCTLTIASNDPALERRTLPPGVSWLRGKGREDLIAVYREADVFVFPTLQDFTPGVLTEALAMALPCITTDIPGVRDLVIEGQTGFRLPGNASLDDWAVPLKRLAADPAELARLSQAARGFAEEKLDYGRFERMFGDVLGRLRSAASRPEKRPATGASA